MTDNFRRPTVNVVLGDITVIAIGQFDIILRKESSRDVQYVRHRVVYLLKAVRFWKGTRCYGVPAFFYVAKI